MDIQMRVHNASVHHHERTVTHEGEEARAMVAQFEVELTDMSSAGHAIMTLRFSSQSKIAEARKMFKQGEYVTMSFAAAAPDKVETVAEHDDKPAA